MDHCYVKKTMIIFWKDKVIRIYPFDKKRVIREFEDPAILIEGSDIKKVFTSIHIFSNVFTVHKYNNTTNTIYLNKCNSAALF